MKCSFRKNNLRKILRFIELSDGAPRRGDGAATISYQDGGQDSDGVNHRRISHVHWSPAGRCKETTPHNIGGPSSNTYCLVEWGDN